MKRTLMLFSLAVLVSILGGGGRSTRAQEGCIDRSDPNIIVDIAALEQPAVGETITDPTFCTTLRRVSDASARGSFETQEYSQLQAISADNQYILLLTPDEGYMVRRMADFSRVEAVVDGEWNAVRWWDEQTLIHFDTNADEVIRVQATDVEDGTTRDLFTFPAPYTHIITNRSSDELSRDGRWLGGVANTSDGWVMFALDVQAGQLGAQLPIADLYADACEPDPEWGPVDPDWVGVSPLGGYLMVQWTRDGTARCSGLESFDIQTGEFVGRVYDGHQHGDMGVDTDGSEFFMTFEIYHPSGNLSIGVRALPGEPTVSEPRYVNVLDWGNGAHISCQGPAGVCLVTADTDPANGWSAFENELFLQYTDGRVERLVHHRSSNCGYWVQPRASLSQDGRYVIFASDWGNAQACDDLGRGDPYVVELD